MSCNLSMEERRAEWVKDLRSGEFKQAQEALQIGDGFCCLGVACKTYERLTGDKLPVDDNGIFAKRTLVGGFKRVKQYFGLVSNSGGYFVGGRRSYLANDNDVFGKLFPEIADIIESKPEGLFID